MYKHISLDFWGTIATPNPEYAKQRSLLIARLYGDTSTEDIDAAYQKTKRILDSLASMKVASNIHQNWMMFLQLYRPMITNDPDLFIADAKLLMDRCANLFIEHPPIIDLRLVETIDKLSDHYTFGIISNVNMTGGNTVMAAINDQLSFVTAHFSDQTGFVKPDRAMFVKAINELREYHYGTEDYVKWSEILHIGDNQICDGAICELGGDYKYVQTPTETLEFLENMHVTV